MDAHFDLLAVILGEFAVNGVMVEVRVFHVAFKCDVVCGLGHDLHRKTTLKISDEKTMFLLSGKFSNFAITMSALRLDTRLDL